MRQYPSQGADSVEVYSDTDWSVCLRIRKSTSGSCLMLGEYLIKPWSSTHGVTSLSSGEVGFHEVTKAFGLALGHHALMRDLGMELPIGVRAASTTTMNICDRQGLGGLMRVDTQTRPDSAGYPGLAIGLHKAPGEMGPGYVSTEHLTSADRVCNLLGFPGCSFTSGRAASVPVLNRQGRTTGNVSAMAEGGTRRLHDVGWLQISSCGIRGCQSGRGRFA